MIDLQHVLVATDFSSASSVALAYGRALAGRFDADLHVVTVVGTFFRRAGIEGYVTDAGGHQRDSECIARALLEASVRPDRGSARTRAVLLKGSTPAVAVAEYAKEHHIDLIVIGSHGHTGLAHRLLGGTAEEIMRLAPCPVLTLKPGEHDFVTPDAERPRATSAASSRR